MGTRYPAPIHYYNSFAIMTLNETFLHTVHTSQSRVEPERLYVVAGSYWRTMLTLAVAVGILAVAGGAYMLVMTFLNMSVSRSSGSEVQSLNRTELVRVVTGIANRQSHFDEIQINVSPVPDPSK